MTDKRTAVTTFAVCGMTSLRMLALEVTLGVVRSRLITCGLVGA